MELRSNGIIIELKMAPSILAKRMICPAYVSHPLSNEDRLRFLGFHAIAVQKVIVRHLKAGYVLEEIEAKANRGRVDLIFRQVNGKKRRQVEVKSAKKIYLYAQYQAALYWNGKDELVISNSAEDVVLSASFIKKAIKIARETEAFIISNPKKMMKMYKPHEELCRICGNSRCSFRTTIGTRP